MAARAIAYGATAVLDKVTHIGQVAQTVRRIIAREPLVATEDVDSRRYIEPPARP